MTMLELNQRVAAVVQVEDSIRFKIITIMINGFYYEILMVFIMSF